MKNKCIIVPALLLIISIGTYFRIIYNGNIRSVEFLSIFAIGLLAGLLISQISKFIKEKKKTLG
jgi:membrane protein CcdC involved in cytochrome C biogenesis